MTTEELIARVQPLIEDRPFPDGSNTVSYTTKVEQQGDWWRDAAAALNEVALKWERLHDNRTRQLTAAQKENDDLRKRLAEAEAGAAAMRTNLDLAVEAMARLGYSADDYGGRTLSGCIDKIAERMSTYEYNEKILERSISQRTAAANRAHADNAMLLEFVAEFATWACDCAQLLDGWHNDGTCWGEFDQSVRKSLTVLQIAAGKCQSVNAGAAILSQIEAAKKLLEFTKHENGCSYLQHGGYCGCGLADAILAFDAARQATPPPVSPSPPVRPPSIA